MSGDALCAIAVVFALYAVLLWRAYATMRCQRRGPVTVSISNDEMYRRGSTLPGQHVLSRHMQSTCYALDAFEQTPLSKRGIVLKKHEFRVCYGCSHRFHRSHPVYLYTCAECGAKFQRYRHLTRQLCDHVALVTGGRTKLGHQVVLKLLRAQCDVILTTRRPEAARDMFAGYADYEQWQQRLHVFATPIDFDVDDIVHALTPLIEYIDETFGRLDILVNCAAQTIRSRDKNDSAVVAQNRYGDAANAMAPQNDHAATTALAIGASATGVNSWAQRMLDTPLFELCEVMRVNAVAPYVLTMLAFPLMQRSPFVPYILNVHAREGLITVRKGASHVHTNMAKAAFHMFTKGLVNQRWNTLGGKRFSVHGCDPGWVSVDEYYDDGQPWPAPPLDEIDGAARILFPLFRRLETCAKTRRHFDQFAY